MKNKLLAAIIIMASVMIAETGWCVPISQVDRITLGGATYQDDQWVLTITSPVLASKIYVATFADVDGCNICNVTKNWGAAINADPALSAIVTASYTIWDGVSAYNPIIDLTAVTAGVPFTASVSVVDAHLLDLGQTNPVIVSIATITQSYADPAMGIPAPNALSIFFLGVILLLGAHLRQRSVTNR